MANSIALTVSKERVGPLAARVAIVALAVTAVPVLYAQPLWVFAATVAAVALVVMAIDRTLVIPIIILAIPLEVSKEYLPSIYDDPSTPRIKESILDAGRLAILAGAGLWAVRARTNWFDQLPRSSLYLPLILLGALFVLSSAQTEDFRGAVRDIFQLASGIGLFVLVLLYVRDRTSLDRALMALVGSGLLLAMVGLYQQATDSYFFNEGLANWDVPRRNATFFDPNIYARFLVVAGAVALGMLASARSWRQYLLVAAIGAALLALLFTSSRSGWVAAALVLPTVVILLPLCIRTKIRLLVVGGIGVAGLAYLATLAEPSLVDRFNTILSGSESLGSRSYLIRAGWQMFLDNPLFGVGLNGYREALEGPYSYLLPAGATNFLSHSAVVTVMAELGLLGLSVLALLFYRFGRVCWRVYSEASGADRGVVAGLIGATLAILVSSQSEPRFIEDPYLWLILGFVVALVAIRQREAQEAAAVETGPKQ